MKDKNPIDSVRFYMKDSPNEPIRVRKDQVLPSPIPHISAPHPSYSLLATLLLFLVVWHEGLNVIYIIRFNTKVSANEPM